MYVKLSSINEHIVEKKYIGPFYVFVVQEK